MQGSDAVRPLLELLQGWAPMLVFVGVWLYFMRRYRTEYRQPWDQILRRLEGIESQLARIAGLLEERRSK